MSTHNSLRSIGFARLFVLLILGLLSFWATPSLKAQSFRPLTTQLYSTTSLTQLGYMQEELIGTSTDSIIVYLSLIDADTSLFHLPRSTSVIRAPHDTVKVGVGYATVEFQSPTAGTYYGKLVASDHATTSDTISLTATVVDYKYPLLIDSEAYFSAFVNDTACDYIQVYNPNPTRRLVVTGVSLFKGGSSRFFVSTALPDTVRPDSSIRIYVCFGPNAVGSETDSLIVVYRNTDGGSSTTSIALHGVAQINFNGCVKFEGDSSTFYLNAGESAKRLYHIRNGQSSAISITSATLSGATTHFTLSGLPTLPLRLAAGADATFSVTYRAGVAEGTGRYIAGITFDATVASGSCSNTLELFGEEYGPQGFFDSSTVDLFPASTQKIDISAPHYQYYWDFVDVQNNSGSTAKIDTVYMLSGAHFEALVLRPSDSAFPFLVQANGVVRVGIKMLDSSQTTYDDTLIIVSEHAILATRYPVHVVIGKAGVSPSAKIAMTALGVYPNPSRGSVTVNTGELRSVEVQVLDILGRIVAEAHPTGSNWVWSGTTPAGAAPNGTYILRAIGIDSQQKPVTLSSRLTIAH